MWCYECSVHFCVSRLVIRHSSFVSRVTETGKFVDAFVFALQSPVSNGATWRFVLPVHKLNVLNSLRRSHFNGKCTAQTYNMTLFQVEVLTKNALSPWYQYWYSRTMFHASYKESNKTQRWQPFYWLKEILLPTLSTKGWKTITATLLKILIEGWIWIVHFNFPIPICFCLA